MSFEFKILAGRDENNGAVAIETAGSIDCTHESVSSIATTVTEDIRNSMPVIVQCSYFTSTHK